MQKLAICGKLAYKMAAPYADKNYDIWFCNWHDDFFAIPRYTLWFDIHQIPHHKVIKNIDPNRLVLRKDLDIDELKGLAPYCCLNNSMTYMLSYAILKGYKDITFYGCTLTDGSEVRSGQRQALRELAMYFRGKGIKISDCEKDLFKGYMVYN